MISGSTPGLRHAVCLTGMERSFSEIGANVREAVHDVLGTPEASITFFGVQPVNDSWVHINSWLRIDHVEAQTRCSVSVPRWYGCQSHGRGDCRGNFVQELCDLDVCERMIHQQEERQGNLFHTVMRLRPDVFWEARLGFPETLTDDKIIVPFMESGIGGLNDHVAFGGRTGMRSFLTRVRQLHQNITRTDLRLLGLPLNPPRKFQMFSEMFLRLALARDGVRAKSHVGWMYCLHTKRALLDQRGV